MIIIIMMMMMIIIIIGNRNNSILCYSMNYMKHTLYKSTRKCIHVRVSAIVPSIMQPH